ncbi:MAG: GNAT family N-acetyltransferase [Pseudomonadota bacterium]
MTLRPITNNDVAALTELYRAVAAVPGGLARLEREISDDYVAGAVSAVVASGIGVVAEDTEGITGVIHARSPGLFCFSHVLNDLTIAVHPRAQGKGVGRQLFERFMRAVRARDALLRVELVVRESNRKAIAFYESLGFKREGVFAERIRNLDGTLEADIPMAWTRTGRKT